MQGIKAILFIAICFILPSVQFAFGQSVEKVSKKTVLEEIEASKKEYYSNRVFQVPYKTVVDLSAVYFIKYIGFKLYNNNVNEICFRGYYSAANQEDYTIVHTSKDSRGLPVTETRNGLRYRSVPYRVCILYMRESETESKVVLDERENFVLGQTVNTPFYIHTQKQFNEDNFFEYLNEKIRGKWQPEPELQVKIEQYNSLKKRAKNKIDKSDY